MQTLPAEENKPRDACGVFGVWAPNEDVAKLTYFGLYALQHRGQESAGIAVGDGENVIVYKDMGLVSQVFTEPILDTLVGHLAVGHCRYSTTGSSNWDNAQPTFRTTAQGQLALGHNGNLTNSVELLQKVKQQATTSGELPFGYSALATTDTELITTLIASHPQLTIEKAALLELPCLHGAFSLVFMDSTTLYGARDPMGMHPLVLGRLKNGWVLASETAALDIVGAVYVRDIKPGELITINEKGAHTQQFASPVPKGCLFEYVYLSRPDTKIGGRSINATRAEVGRKLALEHPVAADLVIPVPESGTAAAIGYAQASGIDFAQGLIKNSYVGRTFISPSQTLRQLGIRLKLNPLRDVVNGKNLIIVDDSIVRGNTQRAIIKMLREVGAHEIHVRIASPPIMWPCYYGIDFATKDELIAGNLSTEQIRVSIEADSLAYISLDNLVAATKVSKNKLCRACFDGAYPTTLPKASLLGKHIFETTQEKNA